jgi:N6-adenosine-specific RNA methylase IME4
VSDERPFDDLPREHFSTVLADPAWKFVTYSERGQGRSASRHYKVMTFEEIASLPVHDVAASDAWLFLWVPGPHLPFGLQLIERWGFRYSGFGFVWAKQNPSGVGWHMGNGFTTRKNAELCLLGRRGKPRRNSKGVRELIVSPRRKHSQKPDEQYARIEHFCSGPYLELFARQRRPGWIAWGDELDKFEPEYDTDWDLPTRPTKTSDTRAKGFGDISVELDAIEPNRLRRIVQEAIEAHLPPDQFEVLKAAEESERDIISRLVRTVTRRRKGGAP